MDIKEVQAKIEQVFRAITPPNKRIGEVEFQWVMDTTNHHYQVLATGFENGGRVHGIVAQIDLKNDLVWIQQDHTDYDIANALIELGLSKDQIVLGFHSQKTRPLTGFAVG